MLICILIEHTFCLLNKCTVCEYSRTSIKDEKSRLNIYKYGYALSKSDFKYTLRLQ